MDNSSLRNFLNRLCKVIWEANVTDPLTYVTQLAYLLFLKMLEENDHEHDGNGAGARIFVEVHLPGIDEGNKKTDFTKLRWSVPQSPKRSLRVEKGEKYVLFLTAALRSIRPGGRAGIVLPNGILFGDTNAHIEVKKRLLAECDLQAVVTLPKGMFEPYTPNPTCFLIFQKTGKPTESVWFYRMQGDGSSLKKARKFGPQFRNDFPDLLATWPKRQTADGVAYSPCVPQRASRRSARPEPFGGRVRSDLRQTHRAIRRGTAAGVDYRQRRRKPDS